MHSEPLLLPDSIEKNMATSIINPQNNAEKPAFPASLPPLTAPDTVAGKKMNIGVKNINPADYKIVPGKKKD